MSDDDRFGVDPRYATEVREVTAWLDEAGVHFVRPGPFHLKIGKINYYFGRGRIVVDGDRQRHPHDGLPALKALLRDRGYLPPSAPADI